MARLTLPEFQARIHYFDRESLHLELRDSYGTESELPRMAAWAAGEPDDLAWLAPYCDKVRANIAAGRTYRRAHVVSEPLSDYHRWSYAVVGPMVEAGDQIRWVWRRLVSSVAFPGNDFTMLDDLVIFHHYTGNGLNIDFTTSSDPHDVKLCREAFEAAWRLGTPHHEYRPS
ncbi:MAG TPA: hypothetical protein VFW27_39825 [Actinoplanes sp.]|jgi:hypothetical protein|nr:hypothetical protein [Actinoplanes sp.]